MKTLMLLRSPFTHTYQSPVLNTPKASQQQSKHQLLSPPLRIPPTQSKSSHTDKETLPMLKIDNLMEQKSHLGSASDDKSKYVLLGAVSVGVLIFLMGIDEQKALALGPEGPLMEEFWDNVRRYGLYILTVSSGALYTIFQPIFELLKNPISAILVLTILGGGLFIVSQVVNAMIGASDFNYEYYY
ncbi:unnamed protein product [Rhodiola kirilowii]